MADHCRCGSTTHHQPGCPRGREQGVASQETLTLRAALASALADRDAHVRGYEDMEQRHAAVVAERDQMRRERDEARGELAVALFERNALRVGGVLRCNECKLQRPMTSTAGYLGTSWPECCGYTMEWVTARMLSGEASNALQAERDALRAEVERLRNENQTAWNKASFLDEDLRHLRAAIEPTDENVRAYYRAQGQHGEARGQDVRDILAAIAARAEGAG